MDTEEEEKTPYCHMKPMELEIGEWEETWFECSYCGHTKEVSPPIYQG